MPNSQAQAQAVHITADLLSMAITRLDDLRDAEARRVDGQMQLRDQYAKEQAGLLATQVSASAETLRVTAQEVAQQSSQFDARLVSLEKSQYESRGSSSGIRDVWGWIIAGATVLISLIYATLHK